MSTSSPNTITDNQNPKKNNPLSFCINLWKRYEWHFVILVFAASVLLGMFGFYSYLKGEIPGTTAWERILHLIYLTTHLFVLEANLEATASTNTTLVIARVLAPIAMGYTVLRGLVAICREKLSLLRLNRQKGHVVICGIGRKGMQLARAYRARGDNVVVIEADVKNEGIQPIKNFGVLVLIGDASDSSMLEQARVHYARRLYAMCGDQGTNVEIIVRSAELHRQKGHGLLMCRCHVVDPALCHLLRSQKYLHNSSRFKMQVLNTNEMAARQLYESNPLHCKSLDPDDCVHLVIAGFGGMGESLALQAARIGHFANGSSVRISILDRNASYKESTFLDRYSFFKKAASISFFDVELGSKQFRNYIQKWCSEPNMILYIALCINDNTAALGFALSLQQLLRKKNIPIYVRLEMESGLAVLLRHTELEQASERPLRPFGMLSQFCNPEVIEEETLDQLAKQIHENYRKPKLKKYSEKQNTQLPDELQPWEKLPEHLKASNRYQADHIPVKLWELGYKLTEEEEGNCDFDGFNEQEIEIMAKMEHTRWCAERFLDGWRKGPQRNIEEKINPSLIPWDELSDEIKGYDVDAVRIIPELVALAGLRLCRIKT